MSIMKNGGKYLDNEAVFEKFRTHCHRTEGEKPDSYFKIWKNTMAESNICDLLSDSKQ